MITMPEALHSIKLFSVCEMAEACAGTTFPTDAYTFWTTSKDGTHFLWLRMTQFVQLPEEGNNVDIPRLRHNRPYYRRSPLRVTAYICDR